MSTDPQRPATLDALTEAPTASRTAPLRMDPAEFRRVGHGLVDAIADFLGSVPARPGGPPWCPGASRRGDVPR